MARLSSPIRNGFRSPLFDRPWSRWFLLGDLPATDFGPDLPKAGYGDTQSAAELVSEHKGASPYLVEGAAGTDLPRVGADIVSEGTATPSASPTMEGAFRRLGVRLNYVPLVQTLDGVARYA